MERKTKKNLRETEKNQRKAQEKAMGGPRQATGPPRSGAGVGVAMLKGTGDPLQIPPSINYSKSIEVVLKLC